MSYIRHFIQRPLSQVLLIISIVITILSIAAIIVVALFNSYRQTDSWTILAPIILTMSSLIITSFALGMFREAKKTEQGSIISTDTIKYPSPTTPEDFEILVKEIVDEYATDGKTMWQRKRQRLRALQNDLASFKDRYRWTGSGKCIIRSLTPGFEIIDQYQDEVWDYFDVAFSQSLKKGEEVEFTIEWELIDEEKMAIPFLTTMIDRDTKYLLLQVILPRELAPKRTYFHEFANFLDTLPIKTEAISWSPASRSIICEVTHPQKYHKYTIRWYND